MAGEPYRPSVEQIAAIRRTRTYVDGEGAVAGEEAGTFNESTRPSAGDVEILIELAVADIESVFAGAVPAASYGDARRAAALKTALAVELSDFGDTAEESSPYLQLRVDAKAAMDTLVNAAQMRDLFSEAS